MRSHRIWAVPKLTVISSFIDAIFIDHINIFFKKMFFIILLTFLHGSISYISCKTPPCLKTKDVVVVAVVVLSTED